jgi:hypothetical protein
MKKIFTLLLAALGCATANSQAILNEVYAIPGSARQEFFEFYNNSTLPVSMDNYTIVTYFEEGGQKGFYVLDLPALLIDAQGFFVGSSSLPFNYQGVSNSSNSQFSWNDLAFLAANNGYIKKWVMGNTVPAIIDGNAAYDLAPVPANFNDFFNKIGGSGATYNVFVFQNGIVKNIFLGGTGGDTFLPTYIVGLPSLYVDMAGTAPDFTINFSSYATANPEYVTQDVGSDNGYIRLRDGYCNTWTKSSAQVNHSPMVSNGGDEVEVDGEISVSAAILRGSAASGSTVNYDVVAGPSVEFPLTLYVYLDNGTVFGELDVNDTFLETKVENTVTDGAFSTIFQPYTENILIQTMTSAGCIDNIVFIPNVGVLPVKLISFEGKKTVQGNTLNWTVAENESGKLFEIEKSNDGRNFTKLNIKNTTNRSGSEQYSFTDANASSASYYRMKLVDRSGKSFYSNVVFIGSNTTNKPGITLAVNPVESYLSFTYAASTNSMTTINVYSTSGAKVLSQRMNLIQGNNTIAIAADGRLYTGAYILEVTNDKEISRAKFIKR